MCSVLCYVEKVLTGILQKINWIDGLRSSKLKMPHFNLGPDEKHGMPLDGTNLK